MLMLTLKINLSPMDFFLVMLYYIETAFNKGDN